MCITVVYHLVKDAADCVEEALKPFLCYFHAVTVHRLMKVRSWHFPEVTGRMQ